MAAEKDLIVAIELGSFSIRGIAGRKNFDGSIQILDIVERPSMNCIRKGIIYNIDKTVKNINSIISQLNEDLDVYINKAYVGIGGQSLRTIRNSVSRQLDTNVVISNEIVENLLNTNLSANYADCDILGVIPQEYRIGTQYTTEPVGILSNHIEGKYLNVIAKSNLKENVQKCFQTAGIEIVDMFISPLALADNLLTDTEKRSGCALVDFGADTTTVAIFKNNLLRYLAVIPLGGNNITQDICSLQLEESDAESLKIKYGSAYTDNDGTELTRVVPLDSDRTIDERNFLEITEARMEEIIANVWDQICRSGYKDKLIAGIIVSGGAANIKNLDKAIIARTGIEKLKIAKNTHLSAHFEHADQISKTSNLSTLISLLSKGELICTAIDPQVAKREEEERQAREQAEREEAQRRHAEEQAAANKKETEEQEEENVPVKKKKSFIERLKETLSNLSNTLSEE